MSSLKKKSWFTKKLNNSYQAGSLPDVSFTDDQCCAHTQGRGSFQHQSLNKSKIQSSKTFNDPDSPDDDGQESSRILSLSVESYLDRYGLINNISPSSYNRGDLFEIAQEVHSQTYSEKYNECACQQYHSWPKHRKQLTKKLRENIYHNFGLTQSYDVPLNQIPIVNNYNIVPESSSLHQPNNVINLNRENINKNETTDTGQNGDASNYKKTPSPNYDLSLKIASSFSNLKVYDIEEEELSTPSLSDHYSSTDEDADSGTGQCSDFNPYYNSLNGIHPPLFKTRTDLMMQWFSDFSDEQKNIFIQRIMVSSGLPQMHMMSLKMEPILHKDCPENCQDMLQWLPENVVYKILEFLDPISLAHACRVNRVWYEYATHTHLWQRFCLHPDYCLPSLRHIQQVETFRLKTGQIKWRELFVERYVCKENWKSGKCRIKTLVGHTQGVSCVQFDETRIVSGSSDKTIRVWDLKSASTVPVLTLVGHSGTVRCLQLNGNRVISGSADGTIKVWDLSVGSDWNVAACKVTMVGHLDIVRCLQVDNEKVISGSYDMTLKVWDLITGRCKLTLRGHTAAVLCVQFDEEKILSGSADKSIKVWSIYTGACLTTFHGHQDAVTCLQFNNDRIISGSLDCTLKFWDLKNGSCIGTIDWISSEGHTRVVRCLQADNWKIVSAGDDKTLKVWSLKTGERFVTLYKHTDGVTCLQFNDHMIVSGSYDKSVKVWDFNP